MGGAGADLLTGGAGRDALHGGEGSDRLEGEEEDDTLEGGSGDDTLVGGEGSDRLRGGDGDDTLQGEAGRDDLDGGNGNDVIRGGADNDALLGSGGDDTLYGGIGSDGLVGDDGNDMLDGEAGNDMLKGGAGADLLFGDSGADTLYGGLGADSLRGGAGADQLYGDADDDDLDGGESDDKLWGGDGKDILVGGAGNDVLSGDAGDDTLAGGLGDDMLAGGAGDDSLLGGGGHDQLFGGAGNDRLMGGPDVDHIDGGDGIDTVVLSGAHADYKIRFNEAVGRFSIVDLRAGSPDGTDLAAIELFEFSDGTLTKAQLNYVIGADRDIAFNVANSDGSKSTLGWRPWSLDPAQLEIFIEGRTINDLKLSETVFRPDGTRLAHAWDVAGTEDWERYVQTYDAQARLVRQQDENDDGTRRIEEWDYAGLQPWQICVTLSMDVGGGVYKDYEQRDTLHEPVPDNSIVDVIERLWDPANQAAWISILREYYIFSENSDHWLTEKTTYDDDSWILKSKDYAQDGLNHGAPPAPYLRDGEWERFEEHYDSSNRKYEELYRYYGSSTAPGHTVTKKWDYNGEVWSDSTLFVEGENWKLWEEVNYDTHPLYSKVRWDWHYAAGDWSEQVTWWNKSGQPVLQEQIWLNDGGSLDHGKVWQWDYTATVTWQRSEYDYKSDKSRIAQQRILYDDGTYVVLDHDIDGQESTYKDRIVTYSDESKSTALSLWTVLDLPNIGGPRQPFYVGRQRCRSDVGKAANRVRAGSGRRGSVPAAVPAAVFQHDEQRLAQSAPVGLRHGLRLAVLRRALRQERRSLRPQLQVGRRYLALLRLRSQRQGLDADQGVCPGRQDDRLAKGGSLRRRPLRHPTLGCRRQQAVAALLRPEGRRKRRQQQLGMVYRRQRPDALCRRRCVRRGRGSHSTAKSRSRCRTVGFRRCEFTGHSVCPEGDSPEGAGADRPPRG